MKRKWLIGVVAAVAAAPATADMITYNFGLDGMQSGTGSAGTGTASVMLDTDTGAVTVSGSYTGLMGMVTASHIHGLAGPGMNAGIVLGLANTGGSDGTFSGMGTLSSGDTQGMVDGLTYINIHSSANPGGEIRGQVVPAPASAALLGVGGLALARRRRND